MKVDSNLVVGAALFAVVICGVSLEAADFSHKLSGPKPWTNERFLDDPAEFTFAVVPDRTGGERKGVFGKAMDMLNLLRPEFVMSVGDLIAGGGVDEPALRKQWTEVEGLIGRLEMPFFHVVGNHDIWTGWTGMTPARQASIDVWKSLFGPATYYDFLYKGCHFVCLDTMERHDYFPPRESLSEEQVEWAFRQIEKNADARWHFVFMHKPIDWTSDRWLDFERRINKYDYTVFCGDWHNHCTATRHGKKYYMIGTAGGGWDCGVICKDLRYGIVDTVTWVTMTKKGPVVANIEIDGVHGDTIQTCATTKGWIETPLDYPSHLAEPAETYAHETNSALVPAEVMHGPGYDWHLRHAVILRQGRVYASKIESPEVAGAIDVTNPKKRVLLLGDETASAEKANYDGWIVFDMGFAGDRIENVLWRVIQGELKGYEPDEIVVSVGGHNRGRNSDAEIDAAKSKLVSLVRVHAPKAVVQVK